MALDRAKEPRFVRQPGVILWRDRGLGGLHSVRRNAVTSHPCGGDYNGGGNDDQWRLHDQARPRFQSNSDTR